MENLRKDWKITTMQHAWKAERNEAKTAYQNTVRDIRINQSICEGDAKLVYEAELRRIKAEADYNCQAAHAAYMKKLADVAEEQDAYMNDFRNYVANLPEADRKAYAEGGEQ